MKKILIITYYWSPAGGAAIQRILKFVQYMVKYDYQPIILTVKKGEYQAFDTGLEKLIPNSCLVFKTGIREPGGLYKRFVGMKQNEPIPDSVLTEKKISWKKKLANWIRLNLFIPDAKIGWKPYAVKQGGKIISKYHPDIIFSSSPPPTVHLIAKTLSKKYGIKWVADFRDPWTNIHYYNQLPKNKLSQLIDKYLEKAVLKTADKITVVNKDFFDEIDNNKEVVIPNGFDSSDFPENLPNVRNDKFTIRWTGSYKPRQYLDSFFDALKEMILQMNMQNSFRLEFIGNADPNVKSKIINKNLPFEINFKDFVEHEKIIKSILQSDMLLLVIGVSDRAPHILSTKIFEYLLSHKPIVAFGPKNGAADKLLQKTKSGRLYDYDNEKSAVNFIKEQIINWRNNKVYKDYNEKEINKYERKVLTKKLIKVFEEII